MRAGGFVGRAEELGTLREAAARAARGAAQFVVVSGEAGIGKSALIAEALASGPISRVLAAWATPASGSVTPFGPWQRALGEAEAPSASALASSAGTERLEISRAVVLESWLRRLAGAVTAGPVAIVLEDLNWADDPSLDLLAAAAANLTDAPLLVIVSVRSDQGWGRLDRIADVLLRRPNVHVIELGALTQNDLADLLARVRPELAAPENASALERILAESGSNTFWAVELARSFPAEMPAKLRELILQPFRLLEGAPRTLVELLAVASRPLPWTTLDTALAVTGVPRRDDAVAGAIASGLVVATAGRATGRGATARGATGGRATGGPVTYGFRHGLAGSLIGETLSPETATARHRALAEALSRESGAYAAESGELADHWFRGGVAERALDASVKAGMDALDKVAPEQAEVHLGRAAELWNTSSDPETVTGLSREEIGYARAEAARWAGDLDRALELIEHALVTSSDRVRRAKLLERLGRFRYEAGDADGAAAAYLDAARSFDAGDDPALAAQIAAARASLLLLSGHPRDAAAVATEAIAAADSVGAERQAAYALSTLGTAYVELGEVDHGMRELLRSQKIARRLHDVEAMLRAETSLCVAYDAQGRLGLSQEAAARAFEITREFHLGGGVALSTAANLMELDWMIGDWERLDALTEQPFISGAGQYESFLLVVRAQVFLARGRFGEAAALLADAERLTDHTQPVRHVSFLLARAQLALWQGNPEAGLGFASDAVAALDGTEEPVMLAWSAALALRAVAASTLKRSARTRHAPAHVVAALDAVARKAQHVPQAVAWLWVGRGELSRIAGAPDPTAWQEAAQRWEAVGRPYERAYALWRLGEALAYRGDRTSAVRSITSALNVADRLGASALVTAIRASAERARLMRPDLPSRMPAPFGTLTQREFEVLTLISRGSSNKQIAADLSISNRTVAVHVSNVLQKLAAQSRTEAAMLAERAGVV